MLLRYLRLKFHKVKRKQRYTPSPPPYTHCKNCGAELHGKYCSVCGQFAIVANKMFRDSVISYFENNYSFDNKLWKTLGYLIAKPGFLSKEFMNGRIVRYVHPFKLYFFSSILLFGIVVGFSRTHDAQMDNRVIVDTTEFRGAAKKIAVLTDSLKNSKSLSITDKRQIRKEIDSLKGNGIVQIDINSPIHESSFERKLLNNLSSKTVKELESKFYSNLSLAVLVLMPIFALLLLLFYRRKERYYTAHLIHSIHIHVVLFMAISLAALSSRVLSEKHSIAGWIMLVWLVYYVISISKFYQERKRKSIFKGLFILFVYLFIGAIVVVGVGLLAVLL